MESNTNNEIFDEINKCTENLLNVINNAKTLSKVAFGEKIEKEELDLEEVINIIIKDYLSELQNAEMSIVTKFKGELKICANPLNLFDLHSILLPPNGVDILHSY